ncbi:MAG: FtsX-like permease family protein [Limimaricola sp.]|uniref:ABC transporter permease n=1 Tax=Limimaricola sp. TaxID=2211665 RepID=UPI001D837A29|nr:ABC transporter permease [Limimaricola sp.]MBI1418850.1 FtsX-like permease family protein [Limimaricola sp.]
MRRAVLRVFWSTWARAPLQLFTLVAGLAMATALWSGVQAINAQARASYDAAARTLGEGQFYQIVRADGTGISRETYVALRRAGWLVSPVAEGRIEGVRIVGLDPLTAPGGLGPVHLGGGDIGAFLTGKGQVFAGPEALAALQGHVDAALVPSADVAPGTAVTDIGVALRLLGPSGRITRLIVAPVQPLGQVPLAKVAPGLVLRPPQAESDLARLTDSFHLNLTAFGLLAFAVGIFIVHGAIGLAFEQRRPLLRTLRALGLPLGTALWLIAAEMAALALAAGALGVVLGYVIAAALLPDVAATLRGLYGADVPGSLHLQATWWLSSLAIALGGAALAGGGGLWRLARMPLLASAQPRAWAMAAGRGRVLQAGAALLLLAAAAVLAQVANSILTGFALLGALLIGAALALPPVLAGLLALGQRAARGPVAQWFWADTRQQLPGLSLALMALLLAMAANVGVSTMVSSFRLTFLGFLDQRLASELYVTADTPDQAAALQAWLAPRVQAVLPIQSARVTLAGQPTDVYGARDHETYRQNWRFLASAPGAWDAVAAGTAVLVNEQLARRAHLAVGQEVTVAGRTFRIVGIYGDYGNPIGQAIVTEGVFHTLFPAVVAQRFGLRLPSTDVPAVSRALQDDFGLPAANIIDQAGIKAFSLGVFDRTFTVTGALNVLTLAVAGFAMLMSLLTLAGQRVPQLAPLWALGLTRARLGALELARAVMLAALVAVLALPLGLVLAWALLAVVNVAAFGWRLPMYMFPWDYARLGLFALGAAVLAAAWPAQKLGRTPPTDLLKVFSGER